MNVKYWHIVHLLSAELPDFYTKHDEREHFFPSLSRNMSKCTMAPY